MKMEGQTCCNDIYFYRIPFQIPIIATPAVDSQVVIVELEELNNYLPVLYFDNDQPNPRSWKKTTKVSYLETYNNYILRKEDYLKEYSLNKTDSNLDTARERVREVERR